MSDVPPQRHASAVKTPSFKKPENFFAVIATQAGLSPERTALVYENCRLSYEELFCRVAAVAKQLQNGGVKAGDKVAVLFPNHPDYVSSFFACAGLGATIVPVNPLLKSEEIEHILADSESSILIAHESTAAEALKAEAERHQLKHIFLSCEEDSISPELLNPAKRRGLKLELLAKEKDDPSKIKWHKVNPEEDLALVVYTSGTTGKPKGAMLTHACMLSIFPERLDVFDINEEDRTLAVLPMCHIYGITILMIGTLSRGGTLAIMPRFEAKSALELIEQEKLTLVPAVPAMYQFMLMELEKHKYDLSAVRICFSGAAALPKELICKIEEKFSAVLIEGFGMTESSCVATINPLKGKRKVGSIGIALPGVQMKIVAEDGSALAAGKENVGEIWIKGPNVMRGYYKQPQATAETIKDGWLATGDLAYKDEEDYYYIVGRKKEMIIRGGFNIYPREVEDVLAKLNGVVEAAVVGIPDALMGERVKAVLVLKDGAKVSEEEVKEYCSQHLADYKIPRIVEFRQNLPRNSTGKILKRLLVESGAAESKPNACRN